MPGAIMYSSVSESPEALFTMLKRMLTTFSATKGIDQEKTFIWFGSTKGCFAQLYYFMLRLLSTN